MAKCEKLLRKAKGSPNNLRFEELCQLAECYGWEFARQDGTSHAIYLHPSLGNVPGSMMNFQNRKSKAKRGQVKQLLDAIEEFDLENANE
jgi:hypothetical protein